MSYIVLRVAYYRMTFFLQFMNHRYSYSCCSSLQHSVYMSCFFSNVLQKISFFFYLEFQYISPPVPFWICHECAYLSQKGANLLWHFHLKITTGLRIASLNRSRELLKSFACRMDLRNKLISQSVWTVNIWPLIIFMFKSSRIESK